MIGTYISAALVCAAALLVGRAVLAVVGRREWSWLEPGVGLAAMIAVSGFFVRAPGHAKTGAVAVVLLLLVSLLCLRLPYRYRDALGRGLPVALLLGLVVAIPFAISGRFGLLGVGINNDLGLHLAWSQWLRDGLGSAPDAGYPLGPHGIATTVAILTGVSLGKAFTGVLIAITVLTGLTALGPLAELGPVRRTVGALLVALPYLAASYFAQSAFKETAEVLFVLAFAISLPGLRPFPEGRRERLIAVAPVAVICAGIVFSYSIVGLAWPLATLAIWGLTIPEVRTAVSPRRVLQWLARPLGIAVSLAVVAAVLVLGVFGPFGFGKVFVQVAGANTYGPTSPAEVFGFWTASSYRLEAPGGAALPWLTTAIAVIAVLCGLIWWIRRRELAVPAALGAGALIYILNLTPLSGDYVRSKALMILAPLMMLVAVRALLSAPWPGFRPPRAAWGTLAVVFLLGAAYSTFLVLRDAPVAPPGHGAELRAFLPRIAGKPVLYAGQDRFAVYELRGSDAHVPVVEFTDKEVVERPTKPFDAGDSYSPIDFDSFSPGTLDRFDYVVTSADAYASQPPRNFKQVARTPSYKLWQRHGPTPANRQTLLEGGAPAAHVDCHTPEMKVFTAAPGRATLFPRPYVAAKRDWSDGPYIHTGERTSQPLDLPAGRWRLSLQYFSPVNLHLTATPKGGARLRVRLPAALDGQRPNQLSLFNNGQFWPVGTLNVTKPGPVELSVQAAGASTLQRLTGYDGTAYLGELAATSTLPEKTVPLARSCGGWIDWYDGRVSP